MNTSETKGTNRSRAHLKLQALKLSVSFKKFRCKPNSTGNGSKSRRNRIKFAKMC